MKVCFPLDIALTEKSCAKSKERRRVFWRGGNMD